MRMLLLQLLMTVTVASTITPGSFTPRKPHVDRVREVVNMVQVAEYRSWMKHQRGWSPHTITQRSTIAERADRWLVQNRGGKHLLRANEQDIAAFLREIPHARTRNRVLGDLRSFYRWAIAEGHRANDPTRGLERVREARLLPRPLTRSQAQALLSSARAQNPRAAMIVSLMLYGGLRRAEVEHLQWGDVDFETGIVRIFGKGSKERVVPMAAPLRAALLHYQQQAPASPYLFPSSWANRSHIDSITVWREVVTAAQAVGLKVTCHQLRHTFATEVLRNGADIRHVQALLGHASLATTQVYTQVNVEDLVDDVARLDFSAAPTSNPNSNS